MLSVIFFYIIINSWEDSFTSLISKLTTSTMDIRDELKLDGQLTLEGS